MRFLKWFRERRAEKNEDRRAIEQASLELRRAGDGPSEEQLDEAADRAASVPELVVTQTPSGVTAEHWRRRESTLSAVLLGSSPPPFDGWVRM